MFALCIINRMVFTTEVESPCIKQILFFFFFDVRRAVHLNPLNAGLNPIYHLLAFLGIHPTLHVSRSRVNIISIVKPTRCTNVSHLFYFEMTLYMFRTVFLSIIWSSRLYIQHNSEMCHPRCVYK